MEYTYILECADGSHYIGTARDLALRLSQHRDGTGSTYTRLRRPLTLVWAACFLRAGEAAIFEEELRWWRREQRDALIEGRLAEVPGPRRRAGGVHPYVLSAAECLRIGRIVGLARAGGASHARVGGG